MVINKKIMRVIRKDIIKYLCMCLLITMSGILFIALNLAAPALNDSINNFFNETKVEDAQFLTQSTFNKESIEQYEEKYNIAIEEQKMINYECEDGSELRIFKENKKINLYSVLEGEKLIQDKQIVLSKSYAKKHSIEIGDKIAIDNREFDVVGYITKPDYLYSLKNDSDLISDGQSFGIAVVKEFDFDLFENPICYYSIRGNQNQKFTEFKEKVKEDNIILKWVDRKDNQRISNINGVIETFLIVGKIVPIAILVVICALIAILMNRLVKEEYEQIGMLLALGYRKMEILFHYLRYSLFLGTVGSVFAILPGILLAKPMTMLLDMKYAMPIIFISIKPFIILCFVLLPFVFLVPMNVYVISKALRITPLNLIRGGGKKKKISWIEKKINLNRFKFKRKFQLREILRNFQRVFITILGAILSTVLLFFGFVLNDSLNYLVDESVRETYLYKNQYVFSSLQTDEYDNAEKINFANFMVEKDSKDFSFMVYGIQSDSEMYNLQDSTGKLLDYNKIIITKPLADKLGVSRGDMLDIIENQSESKYKIKIDEIADTYVGEMIFMPLEEFNLLLDYPKNSFLGLLSQTNLELDSDMLLFDTQLDDFIKDYNNMMQPIRYFVGVMAIMAFIIGLIIIYILTIMLIEENSNNISLLKVMGYNNKRIFSLIVNSTIVLIAIGFCIGLIMVYPLMTELFKIMSEGLSITIPVKLNYINIIFAAIITFISYTLAKTLTQKKLINVSMVDALKNRVE